MVVPPKRIHGYVIVSFPAHTSRGGFSQMRCVRLILETIIVEKRKPFEGIRDCLTVAFEEKTLREQPTVV
jgi:hypothetical protein